MGCSDGSLPAQIWTIFQSDLIQLPLFVLPSLPAAGAEALLCRAAGRAWRVRLDKRDRLSQRRASRQVCCTSGYSHGRLLDTFGLPNLLPKEQAPDLDAAFL